MFRASFERGSSIISLLLFSVVVLNTRFSGITTKYAFPTIVKSRPRHQLEIMHQLIPAAPTPHPPPTTPGYCGAFARLVSPGEGHLQILRCSGPGICQPRGQPFDRHTVSYQNIPTQRILMEKRADWLICQGEGKIVKACSRFDACISSLLIKPELHSKIGSYRRNAPATRRSRVRIPLKP